MLSDEDYKCYIRTNVRMFMKGIVIKVVVVKLTKTSLLIDAIHEASRLGISLEDVIGAFVDGLAQ